MGVTTHAGLVARLEQLATVYISVEADVPDAASEAIISTFEQIRQLGPEGEGPSYLAQALRTDSRIVVMVDPKGLSKAEAGSIPELFAEAMRAADISGTIVLMKHPGRWDHVNRLGPTLALRATPGRRNPHDEEVTATNSHILFETVRSLVGDHNPWLKAPQIELSWPAIEDLRDANRLSSVWLAGDEAHLVVASRADQVLNVSGPGLLDMATRSAVAEILRATAAAMHHTTHSTAIATTTRYPGTAQQIDRSMAPWFGGRVRGCMIGLGWSVTVAPSMWEQVAPEVELASERVEIRMLEGGRRQLTFGDIADWPEWPETTPMRDIATDLLLPILTPKDAY